MSSGYNHRGRAMLLRAIAVGLVAFAACQANAAIVVASRQERSTSVPIRANGAAEYRVLYSAGPVSVPQGGVADVRAQAQLTNDCGNNVGVMRRIVRASAPSDTNGVDVTPRAIENITPGEHHGVLVSSWLDSAQDAPFTNVYYNLVVYATATTAPCNQSDLQVDGVGTEHGGGIEIEVRD